MKRERRQNAVVRTYRILPPPLNPRLVNSSTSPSTAELITNLPSKATSHSKANRKMYPGQVHWLRSNDIGSSSYKLLTWQVLTEPVSNLPGLSDLNGNGDDDDCEDKGGDEADEVETMMRENEHKEDGGGSHGDDESMSFYDVGMMMKMMEHVLSDDEEDGWCLV